jgi:hypothetical protein
MDKPEVESSKLLSREEIIEKLTLNPKDDESDLITEIGTTEEIEFITFTVTIPYSLED